MRLSVFEVDIIFSGKNVNFEIFYKLGAFVVGVVGMGKVVYEFSVSKKSRMRDEYRFAKEFIDDLSKNEDMHPFLREAGYRAIIGDDQISADEIEYLLKLKDSYRTLRDYVIGRMYLDHQQHANDQKIVYRSKYSSSWSRNWRKCIFFFLYILFSVLAFGPFLLGRLVFKDSTDILLASALTIPVFEAYAWLSLSAVARIRIAERLVENQSKYIKGIVLDEK